MAISACVVQDMAGPRLDVASAIAAARALGVDPAVAAALVIAASNGFNVGAAECPSADTPQPGT